MSPCILGSCIKLTITNPVYFQGSTFQAVLATDGQTTIVLIIYGTMTSGEVNVWFSRGDGSDAIVPLSANAVEPCARVEASNVGISGIYVFQIASSKVFEHGKVLACIALLIDNTFHCYASTCMDW